MKRFAEQQQLNEFFNIKKILSSFFNKIKNFFAKLSFGQKFEINLAPYVLQQVNEDKTNDTALLGYLAEWYTGYELYKIILDSGLAINQTNITSEAFLKTIEEKETRIREINKNQQTAKNKIERQQNAGKMLASQIFSDLRLGVVDAKLLTFSIEMTGESGKADRIKADLILSATKDDENTVVDKIMASLKSYKEAKFSLANNTFLSIFRRLFYDGKKTIEEIKSELGGKEELEAVFDTLHHHQTNYNSLKEEQKEEIIPLIIQIFNANYEGREQEVNQRLLKNMGLDGSEEIYAAVAGSSGTQKMKYVSTRQSEEFKTLFEKLQEGFVLSMEKISTSQGKFIFRNKENGDIVIEAPFSISTTGKEKGSGKISSSMKFTPKLPE